MNERIFHQKFSLNGQSFTEPKALLLYSKNSWPAVYSFLRDWFDSEEHVSVQTSGSTGTPKTIQLKKEQMVHSARATGAFFELPEGTTALLCLSPDYIAGKMMLVRAMVLGWQLDVIAPLKNPLEALDKYYDFTAMVPMQVFHSLDHLQSIKKLIIGGGRISSDLEKALESSATEVFATFGMTETITHIAARRLATKNYPKRQDDYRVLPGVHVSTDSRGCLLIDAPKITEEPVCTNDLVILNSEQEFRWLGRYDSIINSGGIKVIPEMVEEKIGPLVSNRFFVTGLPDKILGERVVLIVEAARVGKDLLERLKNETSLSKYELPKEIFASPNFVETATKKIQRQKTLDLIFKV